MAWVKFTQGSGNSQVLLNMNNAESVVKSPTGSMVYFPHDESYQINEDLDKVQVMIAESEGF